MLYTVRLIHVEDKNDLSSHTKKWLHNFFMNYLPTVMSCQAPM